MWTPHRYQPSEPDSDRAISAAVVAVVLLVLIVCALLGIADEPPPARDLPTIDRHSELELPQPARAASLRRAPRAPGDREPPPGRTYYLRITKPRGQVTHCWTNQPLRIRNKPTLSIRVDVGMVTAPAAQGALDTWTVRAPAGTAVTASSGKRMWLNETAVLEVTGRCYTSSP